MDQIASITDTNLTETQFYNRADEINMLSSLLGSTEFNSSPTILLTGIRGVGKTALIKKIKDKFDKEYLVVDIDLSRSNVYQQKKLSRGSIIKIIYDAIIKASKEFGLRTLDKKIEKYFKTNKFKIDKILSYEHIPVPIFESEENYARLADFVMELPQKIYEDNSDKLKGVFIFIDEIQLIKDLDNVDKFLWYMRSFIQNQKNVAYLFCGSMSLKDSLINDLNGKEGAFGGRMLTIEIHPFSKQTTREYIESIPRNILLDDGGFERFYKCTRGIPYYINIFAKILPENITLTENNIIELFKDSIDYLAVHFIFMWSKLTFQEQKIIISLLGKPKRRIEIANTLEVTSGSLNRPLNRLLDFDLIEYVNDKYQITDPILTYWLQNSHELVLDLLSKVF
ncbi:ATP-binding protein [uncultured Methanobrevibacter sp.]|uniref:AAA family ATPase n=1 Tax=uncultured Methanobrevibacter sp. TaxID=253161 RepID=UPI0025EB13BE|nr:ATP-binding protein [uncultured Methanobrevibacter sp.]